MSGVATKNEVLLLLLLLLRVPGMRSDHVFFECCIGRATDVVVARPPSVHQPHTLTP